ncbi:precorrin-6A/cobalt-precorrin-6A reductase [Marinomonas posidonica]|uniref:Precorrin-6A reductase n=1 Tax=Marinomonas posidonica (strain CECT 7376 / NCIMB 14433 / IVIA-Po-181) TaxID=491952 RepID=F6CST9_MARPP|nr:precorrin-6A/cobalt-precorrin-6A reductase [Marinomonas posidonica]AEF53929.1 Precorrin-6A reductase [Marinomonas posidonica IVIA-Po-181]
MKRILLLGGTADARRLADALHQSGFHVIYSLAGLVRVPKVDCELVVGGFTQFGGLARYLQQQSIQVVLDVTHPYAKNMSQKAVLAAKQLGIPCWRFHRPSWQKQQGDDWYDYQDDAALLKQLATYRRPLLSAGQMSEATLLQLVNLGQIESLVWRTAVAPKFALPSLVTWLKAIGPFAFEDEKTLLEQHQIDVIVSKNSGGKATYAKLYAAREMKIPVLMQARPVLPSADREFMDLEDCQQACLAAWR